MTTDFELKVNTEHFIKSHDDNNFVEIEKQKFQRKLDVSQTGRRVNLDGKSEVIDLKNK